MNKEDIQILMKNLGCFLDKDGKFVNQSSYSDMLSNLIQLSEELEKNDLVVIDNATAFDFPKIQC